MSRARDARDALLRALLSAPTPMLHAMAGGAVSRDGLDLDPQLGVILRAVKILGMRDSESVAEARAAMELDSASVAPQRIEMAAERALLVSGDAGDLHARVYTPKSAGPRPALLVFFHGGGWVLGSVASHDCAARRLAHDSGCMVLSVDYRLAPEHKFPAAPLDGYAAYLWARANAAELGADAARVAVGGDSAGGNIAAVITHLAKLRGDPQPSAQLLIYPGADMTRSMPSHKKFGAGFMLTSDRVRWFLGHYLRSTADERDVMGSPLFNDDFSGLAPAVIVTAGFDVLRDEGEAYAEKLRAAGVRVDYTCESGMIHGFFSMTGAVTAASDACRRMAERLRIALA
jgi:acetyl esterase